MEEVAVGSGRRTIWRSKSLTEETASVDEVQLMLEQQLGFDVILLDAKHLPVMSGETTKGKLNNLKNFGRLKPAFILCLIDRTD